MREKNMLVVARVNDCKNENCLAVQISSCIRNLDKNLTVVSHFLLNPKPISLFHRNVNLIIDSLLYVYSNRASALLINVMSKGTSIRYVYIFTPCKRKKKRTMRARSIDARTHKHDHNNCIIIAQNDIAFIHDARYEAFVTTNSAWRIRDDFERLKWRFL